MSESSGGWLSHLKNKVSVFGFNNKTINIIAPDGAAIGFAPRIGFNPSPQAGAGQAAWLEWRSQLTPLIGRERETKLLTDWANELHPLSFKVIEAPGGVGKTRLAAEVTQSLVNTGQWAGGFAAVADFERAQRLSWQGNWFIVVDYPEHSPERLAKLVRAAKDGLADTGKGKLRILLLCRASQGVDGLLDDQGAKSYKSQLLHLPELPPADNQVLLNDALQKLMPSAPTVSQADFDAWLQQSQLHSTALFVVALALHLSTSPPEIHRFLPGAELLQSLLVREKIRWVKAEIGQGLPYGTLADVVAFATLFSSLPVDAVNTNLNAAYKWPANLRSKVHSALSEVWPLDASTQTYPAMVPDLLAAVMLWQWQSQPDKLGVPTDAKLLASLATVDQTGINALLQRWHMHAYDQTVRLQLGLPQDAPALSNLLQNAVLPGSGFANRLKHAFKAQLNWAALTDLAVSTGRPQAVVSSGNMNESQLAESAAEFHNYSLHLAASGNRQGSLKASQESFEIYKRLAQLNQNAYEPDVAMSINNMALRLSDVGDRLGALKAVQKAVGIYERLAKTNPFAYERDLAGCIINLTGCLRENGDSRGALKAAQDAVDIYKRLAKSNPSTYEFGLAGSISNLAGCLSGTGDNLGALKAAQEALGTYERLAKINPAVHEPDLALIISNLAAYLSDVGDYQGALKTAQEAVGIRRRLVKNNPYAYEAILAGSLCNLASFLHKTGDCPGALKAAQEAVALYEKANKQTPGAFDQELAIARRVLGGLG